MAADLAAMPNSGLWVQLGGDAHIANFGAFASPERHLLFGMNDFDETQPGPSSGTSSGWPRASWSRPGRTVTPSRSSGRWS